MNQKGIGKLKYVVAACAAVALGLWLWQTANRPVGAGSLVDVKVPELS
jgi:type IV secretory pathway protease TraF